MNGMLVLVMVNVLLNAIVVCFWKPWATGYSAEKSKNFARKEDIDNILEEVREVHLTQKRIETEFAGGLWNRQMAWNQKKEVYGNLLSAAHEVASAVLALESLIKLSYQARPAIECDYDALRRERTTILQTIQSAHTTFQRAVSLTLIFADPQLNNFLLEIGLAFTSTSVEAYITADQAHREYLKFAAVPAKIIKVARIDLALSKA